jgi:Na+/H+ antiporter family.
MVLLIGITLYTQELTYGLLVGIAVSLILYIPQKLLKFGEAFDSIWTGFQEMFVVTAIVISAFVLQNANDALGLAPYVIDLVSPLINASFLP